METLKIIKIGGNIINDTDALNDFLVGFSKLKGPKILVHGGGKAATEMAERTGIKVNMINGRRITDAATLEIITMVYAGKINTNIVAKLQALNCNAVGFSGADGNTIESVKRSIIPIDYGFVGDIKKVHTSVLEILLQKKIIPVFCAITHDKKGQLLNTNADTIASELAIAFTDHYQTTLYYCFEKNGVLADINDDHSVIEHIDTKTYRSLIKNKIIADGMLPKLKNCFHAIEHKVHKVCIGKTEMLMNPISKFTTIQK